MFWSLAVAGTQPMGHLYSPIADLPEHIPYALDMTPQARMMLSV